jgi:hypothetical protein
MRNAAWLVGVIGVAACSFDHIVVASLDEASAGTGNSAGTTPAAPPAGLVGGAPSAGTGGTAGSPLARTEGDAGRVVIASGGVVDSPVIGTIIGDGGGASVTRCSCTGGSTSELCGTDGITYPTECPDAGPCIPPGIACLQACPCPDGGVESAGTTTFTWFPEECVSTAHCTEGMICMTFRDADITPTACVGSN